MKNWIVSSVDKDFALKISQDLGITPFLSVLLSIRGFNDKEDILKFLNEYKDFSSPHDFIDMDKFVLRLRSAIDNFEKICIYGDYDADGITATVLMYLYLKDKGANVIYYIPKREEDGYGLNVSAIDYLKECDVDIILTVDNGISAEKEIEYAQKIGIDTIVTDHHRPPTKIPNAFAVVDPFREDCKSKFKNFAGVGVAFKAIVAMEEGNKSLAELMDLYGDLVTIGTIGDSIELKGETRDFIKKGLACIENSNRPAIKVILEKLGLNGKVLDSMDVAFNIVPKINACGRMGSADKSIKFLLSESVEEAEEIYSEMYSDNDLRKSTESKIMASIEQQLKLEPQRLLNKIIICEGKGWHPGVLGIVSARVTEKYGKPSIIISYDDEDAKGSGRSIEGFCLHSAISECEQYLDRFGGHPMAVGINLKTCNIGKFKECLLNYADKFGEMPLSKLCIDFKISPLSLSDDVLDELDKLKPFGSGNKEPVFGLYNMKISNICEVGGGKHLRLTLERNGKKVTAMYFGKNKKSFLYDVGDNIDLAVTMHKNSYAGYSSLSLFVKDVKVGGLDTYKCLTEKRVYEKFKLNEKLSQDEIKLIYPDRQEFALVYRYIKLNKRKIYTPELLSYKINNELLNSAKIRIILDVMQELDIMSVSSKEDEYYIAINDNGKKVNLKDSQILSNISKNDITG